MSSLPETVAPTVITIHDSTMEEEDRGKAPLYTAPPSIPPPPPATTTKTRPPFLGFLRKNKTKERGWRRIVSVFDFIFRLVAVAATLAATMAMATADETLPFFTQHFQFHASYDDLPSLSFFVIGNAIATGFMVLSLPFSIILIICPSFVGLRLLLLVFDLAFWQAMVVLTTAAASAAASIVQLAHTGNSKANWVAICLRFDGFCQQISGAVVASFVGMIFILFLVLTSALALRNH